MNPMHDISGERFGKLVAIEPFRKPGKQLKWLCKCDCGKTLTVYAYHLKTGHTQSCGCLKRGEAGKRKEAPPTKLYRSWTNMKSKCNNRNDMSFKYNGGRGIIVCEEWDESFKSFQKWAMENGYKDGLTLVRKDVSGDYCPENCEWKKLKK